MADNTQQSIEFYEKEAESYDEMRWRSFSGRYVDAIQKDIVLELIGDCSGKKVLDVATGTGRFALEIAKLGADVTALDSSKEMLRIVEKKFERANLTERLTVVCNSATKLPFNKDDFDICVCINALNHIPMYNEVIREIARVLSSEGTAVTNYTNWLSCYMPFGMWVNIRGKSVTRDVYTKWFFPGEIFRLHRSSGLIVKEVIGAVQIPNKVGDSKFSKLLMNMDKLLRKNSLRYMAPQLFVKSSGKLLY